MMLAAYVAPKIEMSSLLKRLTRNLASALAFIGASLQPSDRLRAFAELIVVPYALSRRGSSIDLRRLSHPCARRYRYRPH